MSTAPSATGSASAATSSTSAATSTERAAPSRSVRPRRRCGRIGVDDHLIESHISFFEELVRVFDGLGMNFLRQAASGSKHSHR